MRYDSERAVAKSFPLEAGWPLVLKDLRVDPAVVLRRARLPTDLFSRPGTPLGTEEYFRLWEAIETEVGEPLFALRLGQAVPVEAFHPPIFAAMCSPNFAIAAQRLSRYKRLIAPMALVVESDTERFAVTFEWLDGIEPPTSLAMTELVFTVSLVRTATREPVVPTRVEAVRPPSQADYASFFGVAPVASRTHALVFEASDAQRPFLTANDAMWQTFEPTLRQRLSELDAEATTGQRVRGALLEALPSGESSIEAVARRLAVSKRTLQRRLKEETTTYQAILTQTREELALHYLRKTELSGAEISYLLGYEDPNSFFRAFHEWTGTTTERARAHA